MKDGSEVRCAWKLHARIISPGIWEFKCNSRHCGAGNGVVVLHQFSIVTGELVRTLRFRDPAAVVKEVNNGTNHNSASVRPA